MLALDVYENFLKGRRRSHAVAGGGLPLVLGLALLHFASMPLLSRLHDDDVSVQQVLVQFPCTYVCHVCVIR